jgi:hypothetical protein
MFDQIQRPDWYQAEEKSAAVRIIVFTPVLRSGGFQFARTENAGSKVKERWYDCYPNEKERKFIAVRSANGRKPTSSASNY